MECPVLKTLKPTAGEMLRGKAVRVRVTSIDAKQHATSGRLQSIVEYYAK